jgi:hypothetical protein
MLRVLTFVVAAVLLTVGVMLGYIAIIALRRSEGVFLPAGYVAAACLVAGGVMCRVGLRW